MDLERARTDPSADRARRRRLERGELLRIAHGVSVDAAEFRAAAARERHRTRVEAVMSSSRPGLVACGASAVALHGLPWFGPFPDRPTVLDPARDRAQHLRFSDKVPARGRTLHTVSCNGLVTTDLVSTAIDVALRFDRGHAIAVLDRVLRSGVTREELVGELASRSTVRGAARAAAMVDLADGASESVGESLTRLVMHDSGVPAPVLQHEFTDHGRVIARTDFWFPEFGVVVEFDGLVKYQDRSMRAGRSIEQVVIEEKIREDRVRALEPVSSMARLIWRDVMPGAGAPRLLRDAGLPVRRGLQHTPAW